MLDCRRKPELMDIDINIRQELAMLLSGSSYGQQQQVQQKQQQQQAKKANVELFAQRTTLQERRQLKPPEQVVACPRCQSLNTKFCYYNNYSLTQPRHFCKSCRRYWTAGGTLRNVPVGGGCRKIKRSSSSSNKFTYHHQHLTADHHDAFYSPGAAAHGIIAHGSILDSCNNMSSHAAGLWQLQQQHMPSFAASAVAVTASLFHNVDKLAATAFESGSQHAATALQPSIMHESTDRLLEQVPAALSIDHHHSQQPFESSIMNLGLFNSVQQQQQHPDVAANLRHLQQQQNSSQHAPLCNTGSDDLRVILDSSNCCRELPGVFSAAASTLSEGLCSFNQLPSDRTVDLAADQENTTTTTPRLMEHFHNDNNTRAESWRVLLQQMPKQEEDTSATTPLQQWPVQEHTTTLQQGSSLDLNRFKDHVKAKFLQTQTRSLSHLCTQGLGAEQEQEDAQCVQQQGPAAAHGATAPAASWQQDFDSASHQHHHHDVEDSGMPQYEFTAPHPDTSSFWSNPAWSHLDLHTLCGSGGATLL